MDRFNFNPDGVGVDNGNYFALPFDEQSARLVLVSLPWDVTVSYGDGTALAPAAILEESSQIDFYDELAPDAWRRGIATVPINPEVEKKSKELRSAAQEVISDLEMGREPSLSQTEVVNRGCEEFNAKVKAQCEELIQRGKIVGVVGGDHSTPYGAIAALAESCDDFGILHIDAHRDLRRAYEGFDYSHASVMYNVLERIPQVSRLVQVAVRDFSQGESDYAQSWGERVATFSDYTLSRAAFQGKTWSEQCREIVDKLPQRVYISFDIDGLSIELTPSTGTPVPGGLSFNQATLLLEMVAESGREIIGFDLVEVTPFSRVDTIVGVRMLWKLCGVTLKRAK
ncbi:MAG: agmatinase family protein [Rikenellaceae bacterium]